MSCSGDASMVIWNFTWMSRSWQKVQIKLNHILHGLFQVGSTRGMGGGHKVPAAFFSETVKATAIKVYTLAN